MKPDLDRIEAQRIALIKPSALGDIVHALPVLGALRQRFPTARIVWVVYRTYAELLEGHPDLDGILAFDRGRPGWGVAAAAALADAIRRLRQERCDLVVDLQGLFRSGLLTWCSGARRRVGLFSAREGAQWTYTDVLSDPQGRTLESLHAVERYWLVADALGVGHLPKRFWLPLAEEDRSWCRQRLAPFPRPWLAVHLGTRWPTKRWPVEHFAELCQRAVGEAGGSVVLIGSGADAGLAAEFRSRFAGALLDLTGQTTLRQLSAVVHEADIVVSNDSGPLHLAAAWRRPVVAPFTCSSVVRSGPYGQKAHAVATQVWCAASYRKRCARLECMAELTPDRLWPVLEGHLQQWQRQCA
jgi:lipopolysaccharide heptosyltransferase II